jgi:translation elongation factor EF-1alpha
MATKKKKSPVKKRVPIKKIKPVGKVTHYYAHIKVAIVKFNTKIKAGTELYFKGATTDFKEASKSMQLDHEPVAMAMPKKQIGLKLKKRVRKGDLVYKI